MKEPDFIGSYEELKAKYDALKAATEAWLEHQSNIGVCPRCNCYSSCIFRSTATLIGWHDEYCATRDNDSLGTGPKPCNCGVTR